MAKMKKIEPSLQAMKLLASVAAEGKLRKAARRVGMSQSAASHALSALESTLGATLFVRDPAGLKLSETGLRLLPHVRKLLDGLDAIRAEVSGLAQLQGGALRIASVPTLAATIVPRLMAEFKALYPGIELTLFEGTDDEVREWVLSGMSHVGFAGLPVAGLISTEITQDEWLALVPAHDFPRRKSIDLATLSRRNFLLSGGGCEPFIMRLFEEAGLELPEHRMVNGLTTIQAMVAEDLGVSLVPSINMTTAPRGTRCLPLAPRRFRRIGVLEPDSSPRLPVVEAWISLTVDRFRRHAANGNGRATPAPRASLRPKGKLAAH